MDGRKYRELQLGGPSNAVRIPRVSFPFLRPPSPHFNVDFRSACVKTNSLESVFNIEMGVRGGGGVWGLRVYSSARPSSSAELFPDISIQPWTPKKLVYMFVLACFA